MVLTHYMHIQHLAKHLLFPLLKFVLKKANIYKSYPNLTSEYPTRHSLLPNV